MEEQVRTHVGLIAFVAIMFITPLAAAQTANAEAMARERAGFSFTLGGALLVERGNVRTTNIGGSAHTQFQTLYDDPDPDDDVPPFMRQRVFVNGSGAYERSEGIDIVSESFAHARWTAMWFKRLGTELFAQHQYAKFERLQARVLGGVGLRAVPIHHDMLKVAVGTGYMLEFERLIELEGSILPRESVAHRWTSFLNMQWSIIEGRLTLSNVVYVQPRLDDFSDFRVLEEVALDVAVTDVFSFGTALRVAHNSEPPEEVVATDLELSQTIKLRF